MTYLAHIAGDGRKQTAAEHLNGTAERCALFAAPFGAEELGRLASAQTGVPARCASENTPWNFSAALPAAPRWITPPPAPLPAGVWGSLSPPLRRRDTTAASRTEALRWTPRMPEPFWDG